MNKSYFFFKKMAIQIAWSNLKSRVGRVKGNASISFRPKERCEAERSHISEQN